MKKTLIFIAVLSLTLTLLTATPVRAGHWNFGFYWPGFTVGVGVPPPYYYPAPPSPIYYYPPSGYYRPGYGYYGGYYRPWNGYYDRGYRGEGNYDRGYQGGNHDGEYQR